MSDEDKLRILESFISTAEYSIANYLKDHDGCGKKELMNHVLNSINLRKNRRDDVIHVTKPLHVLAWLIAFKELERESVIRVERYDVPFPMVDNKSQFYLK